MSLLRVNTGDEKLDKAYENFKIHVDKCKSFEEFLQHFNYIVKTDDAEVLKKWLLKVLFVSMKQESVKKHDFDVLLESVDDVKREEIQSWLRTALIKHGDK